MAYLHEHRWDGVVSLECSGTDENTRKSVEWMKGVLKGLGKAAKRGA
jgi:sugar phosphate isomerase/epimerase